MKIIAADSNHVRPFKADTLFTTSGERFDCVLHANQVPENYWMRVKSVRVKLKLQRKIMLMALLDLFFSNIFQIVLHIHLNFRFD